MMSYFWSMVAKLKHISKSLLITSDFLLTNSNIVIMIIIVTIIIIIKMLIIIAELLRAFTSRAPFLKKFGNPSISKILVVT